ncbi:CotH kinase family protein [Methanorbis rubei]|uniref:Spore coat protein CotH n=1 Tax=Methanorbis rubei TaxID=3028300 RepID=A0AAE4SAT2_9EURY|nr:hypothetical protein [Methanocorpusculaceae archaeon Cs1]
MIDAKYINLITILCVVAAAVLVGVLMFAPDLLGITEKERTVTYASMFDEDTITEINIVISDDQWNDILTNPLAEEYHRCDIVINGVTYPSVGIRTKGLTSLSQVASSDSDRYSFKLKADEYVNDQSFAGLSEFVINNVIQDATYMKEYLSYDLMAYMGVPTPLVTYANISINGEPFGLYVMIESVEDDFASRVFGVNYGNLYKPESMDNVGGGGFGGGGERPEGMESFGGMGDAPAGMEMGNVDPAAMTPSSRQQNGTTTFEFSERNRNMVPGNMGGFGGNGGGADLIYTDDSIESYAHIFNNTVLKKTKTADKQRVVTALKHLNEGTDLETYVDVDEVLRYFAANTALVNLDSYVSNLKHNYYLYEDGKGQISILPWDFNLAFGAFQSGSATSSVNFPIDTPVTGVSLEDRPLIGKLLEVPEYKERYHQYLQEILDGYFASGYFAAKIDSLNDLISPSVEADPTAFYSYAEYQKAIEALKLFGELRAESIAGQLDESIPSTDAGQTENPSALIDASGLNMNDMGSMGGGGGAGGFGEGFGEGRNQNGGGMNFPQ